MSIQHTYKNIIIGIDFNHHPERVIQKAAQLLIPESSKVHIVHTLHYMPETYYDHYAITSAELDNTIRELKKQSTLEAEEKLNKIKIAYPSLPINTHILQGPTVDALIDFAEEQQADLILLGNYHKPGFIRLLGSTINGIVQHSPCDVLVVKA